MPSAVSKFSSRFRPCPATHGKARATIKLFITCLLVTLAGIAAAQEADVAHLPPPLVFDSWRKMSEAEESSEWAMAFASAYRSEYPENDTVSLRIVMPTTTMGPVPVVILLHYLGASDLKVERSVAGHLAQRGIASVMVTLPYHMSRTPRGRVSGELAVQPDPVKLVGTMTQSVWDVRRTIDWIQTRPEFDGSRIGIGGTSLGAIVSTLAFALDERIQRASFMLSGGDLAHILWHSSKVVTQREALRGMGYTESKLRDALKGIEPLEYLPRRKAVPSYVVGARYDTVIPPADTEKLITALGAPKVLWLDTGHYGGAFVQGKLLRSVADFFSAEFSGRSFEPPKRIYAPTIRVGIDANPVAGLQVGVGLDLFKLDPSGSGFGSLIFTPRGAQLFLGKRIDRGFAIGLTLSSRGFGPSAFWSAVL